MHPGHLILKIAKTWKQPKPINEGNYGLAVQWKNAYYILMRGKMGFNTLYDSTLQSAKSGDRERWQKSVSLEERSAG